MTRLARDEWKRIAPILARVATRLDSMALALYCEAYARWRKNTNQCDRDGWTYKTNNGLVKKHPAAGMAEKASDQMVAYLREFGMTPLARTRVETEGGSEKSSEDREAEDILGG